MAQSPDRTHEALCPGCGCPNASDANFCAACGAPLTWHATTDPLASVFAKGYAARRALRQPSKPIIAIGVWLWMLPLAVVSLALFIFVLASLLYGLFTFEFVYVIDALVVAVPAAVGLCISSTFLYRVTRGYMRGEGAGSSGQTGSAAGIGSALHRGQSEGAANAEHLACLTCGDSILAGVTQCPACGWSYARRRRGRTKRRT
jgi:hypothetical protein